MEKIVKRHKVLSYSFAKRPKHPPSNLPTLLFYPSIPSFPILLPKIEMYIQQSITSQTYVSITLANHILSKKFPNSNTIFSQISIHVVLSLVATTSNGQPLDQLLSFLKTKWIDNLNSLSSQLVSLIFADGSRSGGPCLSFTNGVWVEQTFLLRLLSNRWWMMA